MRALADKIDPRKIVSADFGEAYPKQVAEGSWCISGAILIAASDALRSQSVPPPRTTDRGEAVMRTPPPANASAIDAGRIGAIVRDVAELPDRTSPEDEPDMMLVTADELTAIILRHSAAPGLRLTEWRDISEAPKDGSRILASDGHQTFIAAWPHPDTTGTPRKAWREVWHLGKVASPQPKYWQPLPTPPTQQEK